MYDFKSPTVVHTHDTKNVEILAFSNVIIVLCVLVLHFYFRKTIKKFGLPLCSSIIYLW